MDDMNWKNDVDVKKFLNEVFYSGQNGKYEIERMFQGIRGIYKLGFMEEEKFIELRNLYMEVYEKFDKLSRTFDD